MKTSLNMNSLFCHIGQNMPSTAQQERLALLWEVGGLLSGRACFACSQRKFFLSPNPPKSEWVASKSLWWVCAISGCEIHEYALDIMWGLKTTLPLQWRISVFTVSKARRAVRAPATCKFHKLIWGKLINKLVKKNNKTHTNIYDCACLTFGSTADLLGYIADLCSILHLSFNPCTQNQSVNSTRHKPLAVKKKKKICKGNSGTISILVLYVFWTYGYLKVFSVMC